GRTATSVGRWDGSSWSALSSGMGGPGTSSVISLAVLGSDLYAGGYFFTAGSTAVVDIAKWNGSSWSALGSGLSGPTEHPYVYALTASGSHLYGGGGFTVAGGNPAS